ncbi:MAG: MmcQ/YjbR family DNA-binding protein [Devosia sp.]|uniref:MmcQ/YjbR family DNA-binding protein n=1 Tax=Devosia sp. TaxID=1871048 RepID=UPI0024CDC72D|nr:MmcQ/YjbR family DNA-binding protein [Devosia sp.]UYO00317.1 MAG: MmcQ/YjbR family DNA-binding protein [Devosia sp.]
MTKSETFTQIAMSLEGTRSAPHFDRIAFKVRRTFATLAADGMSANLKFTPDEQEFKCAVAPDLFSAIPNGWGRQGWTVLNFKGANADDMRAALVMAHAHGAAVKAPK